MKVSMNLLCGVLGALLAAIVMNRYDAYMEKPCPCDTGSLHPGKPVTEIKQTEKKDTLKNSQVKKYNPAPPPPTPYYTDDNKSSNDYEELLPICKQIIHCDDTIRTYEDWSSDSLVYVKDSIQGKRLAEPIIKYRQIEKLTSRVDTFFVQPPPVKTARPGLLFIGGGLLLGQSPFISGSIVTKHNIYGVLFNPIDKVYGAQVQIKIF